MREPWPNPRIQEHADGRWVGWGFALRRWKTVSFEALAFIGECRISQIIFFGSGWGWLVPNNLLETNLNTFGLVPMCMCVCVCVCVCVRACV